MDTESKDLIKNRIAELPEGLRNFVEAGSWRENVSKVGKQFNLKPEQATALENEVFLTLLCFEPPSDLKENIKAELGLDENAGRRIADSLNGAVLGRVMKEIKEAWAPQNASIKGNAGIKYDVLSIIEKKEDTSIKGNTGEKAEIQEKPKEDVLEIMKRAMQPAVPKMEPPKGEAPTNLPIKGYEGSKDPYREPVEP